MYFEAWEAREMPSPIRLMALTSGTQTNPQDMYYSLMGMRKSEFDRADSAVQAMEAIRKGGLGDLFAQDIDKACNAITSGILDDSFDHAISSMADTLAYISKSFPKDEDEKEDAKAKDEDKDKDKDEDEDKVEEAKEIEGEADEKAEPEEEVIVESEEPPAAPQKPAFDFMSLMEPPQQGMQIAVDPKLVMKALQMLQSIGAMC